MGKERLLEDVEVALLAVSNSHACVCVFYIKMNNTTLHVYVINYPLVSFCRERMSEW